MKSDSNASQAAQFAALPPGLQDDALIDIRVVRAMVGFTSSPPIYDRVRKGTFPQPVRLSARCTRWKVSAVRAWLAAQTSQAPA
jgi:prophage regulatory protein